jgi:holo-[acyl-carrier protein] synthase
MIYAIGHDIVDNQRIDNLLRRLGLRFVQRILTPEEITLYTSKACSSNFVAKRFAAKEAFAKACGTGIRAPVVFANISILNDDLGKPYLLLANTLAHWLQERGINKWHITLSDERQLSSAIVILEKPD